MKNLYKNDHLIADFPAWKYIDFERKALQISHKLRQDNISSVALWIEDRVYFACALLAAWHANVRVILPSDLTAESLNWANESADLWITDSIIKQQSSVLFDEFATDTDFEKQAKNRPLFWRDNQTEVWFKTSDNENKAGTLIKTAAQMWSAGQMSAENRSCTLSNAGFQHIYGQTVHIMTSLVLGRRLERKQGLCPELIEVEKLLIKNKLVNDCYIEKNGEQQNLAAWVELNDEGIEIFRSQGRKTVVEQLDHYLTENQEEPAIPIFWRFTDKLPRNSQLKTNYSDFKQAFNQPLIEPVWTDSYVIEPDTQIFKGKVPLDLIFFEGHFAEFPLVPGVIEVQWVMDKMTEFFGEEKQVARIDNLKFQKFLRPNDELELILKWNADKNRIEFQLKTENEICGKGSVIISA